MKLTFKARNKTFSRIRRKSAMDRLLEQLKSGMKNTKDGLKPLSEDDIKRIENEIKTLEKRV